MSRQPSASIFCEADLIEEVGRHHGFDKLEPTYPASRQPAPAPDPRVGRDRLVRRTLTGAGFSEAITFGFIEAKAAELYATANDAMPGSADRLVSIANPLSAKFDTLRQSLLPGLVDAVAHNRRHGRRDVRLFEIGTRFAPGGETRAVAFAWTGSGAGEHWSGGARDVDFFDVKGVAEHLCDVLGVQVRAEARRDGFLVPGQTAALVVAEGPERGTEVGFAGQISPAVADARGLPRQDRVFAAELSLDALWRAQAAPFDAGARCRGIRRWFAICRSSSPIPCLPDHSWHHSGGWPRPACAAGGGRLFDRYQGQGVPQGAVSLSSGSRSRLVIAP